MYVRLLYCTDSLARKRRVRRSNIITRLVPRYIPSQDDLIKLGKESDGPIPRTCPCGAWNIDLVQVSRVKILCRACCNSKL